MIGGPAAGAIYGGATLVAPERIIILAPHLRSTAGHHLTVCTALADAVRRRGLAVDIVVEKEGLAADIVERIGARALLSRSYIPWELPATPYPDYDLAFRLGKRFGVDARALDALLDDRPTLIVVDGLQPARFYGLATWLTRYHANRPIGVLHMAFTFNLLDRADGALTANHKVYAALASAVEAPRAGIAVFGMAYQNDFNALTGLRAMLFPLPLDLAAMPRAAPDADRPLILFVNTAIPETIDAAIACATDRFVRRHFMPTIKIAGSGEIASHLAVRLAEAGVPVLERRISREQYVDLFRRLGVMVFAYSPIAYKRSTSGIMADAAAAGMITVVPAGTWLAETIDGDLAAGIAVDRMRPPDLVHALRTAHRVWNGLAAEAVRRASAMRAAHSADLFVAQAIRMFPAILGDAASYGKPIGTRLGFESFESRGHLLQGWSFAEPWGRWLEGDHAQLRLYVLAPDNTAEPVVPRFLHIEAMGLTPPGGPQVVDVVCNGMPLGACRFEVGEGAPRVFTFALPAGWQALDLRLDFRVRYPVRPLDLGVSQDPRRLGFGLISLCVSEDD